MLSELGGTLPQWGAFISLLGIVAGGITVYIKGIPQRIKASSDAKQAENADYADQIQKFRDEVHGYRNELQASRNEIHAMQGRLTAAESASRLRADRITNMTFIIRLLISELRRLDPQSIIVQQAEALMNQMQAGELNAPVTVETDASEAAHTAVTKAQDTVMAAQATVEKLEGGAK